jgi:hypothetical protein
MMGMCLHSDCACVLCNYGRWVEEAEIHLACFQVGVEGVESASQGLLSLAPCVPLPGLWV